MDFMKKRKLNFYKMLNEQMKKKDLTNEKVAKVLGVHKSMIQKYRSGESNPNFDKLIVLSDFFGVSIDYLLTGKEKVNKVSGKKEVLFTGRIVEAVMVIDE